MDFRKKYYSKVGIKKNQTLQKGPYQRSYQNDESSPIDIPIHDSFINYYYFVNIKNNTRNRPVTPYSTNNSTNNSTNTSTNNSTNNSTNSSRNASPITIPIQIQNHIQNPNVTEMILINEDVKVKKIPSKKNKDKNDQFNNTMFEFEL